MRFVLSWLPPLLCVTATFHLGDRATAQSRVLDLDPLASSTPWGFVEWRGDSYCFASDSTNPTQRWRTLWRSDGTATGTTALNNSALTRWRLLDWLTATPRLLYFAVTTDASGRELWATDGTTSGRREVLDIGPDAVGDELFFLAVTSVQTRFGLLYSASNQEL